MAVAQILLLLFVVALGCCLCYCVQSHFFQGDDSEIEASPDWLTFFHCIREDCGSSCIINLQKVQYIPLSIWDCIQQLYNKSSTHPSVNIGLHMANLAAEKEMKSWLRRQAHGWRGYLWSGFFSSLQVIMHYTILLALIYFREPVWTVKCGYV